MDDSYLLALGFERWVSDFPQQTAMYVFSEPARDGARLYISIPRAKRGQVAGFSSNEQENLQASIDLFFRKHGGKHSKQPAKQSKLVV
ncbi:hypothetical protein [Solirubrum puertoriconensis]|uniref:Uncharacterized protein n=1 Tax=Solirubrum puertoriconensis TaxID=1751427 RepID=A0A9X0HMS0_SOLP1|nr:hypothetical protein [Solirubrum puertoriconensis]KUG08799.1 hypothetical protein ASU33_11765 [Solirubrum puertoriconensis]